MGDVPETRELFPKAKMYGGNLISDSSKIFNISERLYK